MIGKRPSKIPLKEPKDEPKEAQEKRFDDEKLPGGEPLVKGVCSEGDALQKGESEPKIKCPGDCVPHESAIGSEIRVLSNLIGRAVENSPRKKQIDQVTGTNAWIIGYIADQGERDVFQRDLERKFGITRSTASKVVNLMVKKGLIERRSIPEDARLKKLVLTDRAIEVLEMMREDFELMESTLGRGFSEEELARFFDYMHRMQANIRNFG